MDIADRFCRHTGTIPFCHAQNAGMVFRWNGVGLRPSVNGNWRNLALFGQLVLPPDGFDYGCYSIHNPHNDYFSHSVKGLIQ